jgi:hypothetical protein
MPPATIANKAAAADTVSFGVALSVIPQSFMPATRPNEGQARKSQADHYYMAGFR